MLLSRKKITEDLIEMMMGWRHSGFNVYYGPRIKSGEEEAMNPRSFTGPLIKPSPKNQGLSPNH